MYSVYEVYKIYLVTQRIVDANGCFQRGKRLLTTVITNHCLDSISCDCCFQHGYWHDLKRHELINNDILIWMEMKELLKISVLLEFLGFSFDFCLQQLEVKYVGSSTFNDRGGTKKRCDASPTQWSNMAWISMLCSVYYMWEEKAVNIYVKGTNCD